MEWNVVALVMKRRQNPHVLHTFDKLHNPSLLGYSTASPQWLCSSSPCGCCFASLLGCIALQALSGFVPSSPCGCCFASLLGCSTASPQWLCIYLQQACNIFLCVFTPPYCEIGRPTCQSLTQPYWLWYRLLPTGPASALGWKATAQQWKVRPTTQRTSERPKVLNSAPYPSVFCTFDFEMCLGPQRRALFRHLNFRKCSDVDVFCTF